MKIYEYIEAKVAWVEQWRWTPKYLEHKVLLRVKSVK
jgi:hypothetical protein